MHIFREREHGMSDKMNRRNFMQRSVLAVGAVNALDVDTNRMNIALSSPDMKAEMPMSILGRTGRRVSRLSFGGGSRYFQWVPSEPDAEKLIEHAINLGITYFDTAHTYGQNQESEIRFGKYLTPKYRDKIFLATKMTQRDYDGVMKEFEKSLEALKTDHVDLLHMHGVSTMEDVDRLLAANGGLKAIRKFKDEGSAKNIGFSWHVNWGPHIKKALDEFDPDVVMTALNASRDTGAEEHFLPIALERNIGIVAMKATAQNALIGKVSGKDLVRYSFSLPVHVVNIGMDGYATLESCVELAREKPLSEPEREALHRRLAFSPGSYDIPYHRADYCDGWYA